MASHARLRGKGDCTALEHKGETSPIRRVVVVGAGYVGLPLCLHLAKAGLEVLAVDTNPAVVESINNRTAKVDEKEDFERWFQDPDVRKNLAAQLTPAEADAFVIAVPTPVDDQDKRPELSAVIAASKSIVPHLRQGNLVVIESTIPPRTTSDLVRQIIESGGLRVGTDVYLAHCPERILPGNIMSESVYNARVIGGVDDSSTDRAAGLFATFVKGKLHRTNDRTAEFVKLIENSYRDVNIAFANQVKVLCEELEIDAMEAIRLANEHPRVDILDYGIGVGGHCIPVDPWFLVHAYPESTTLLRSARELNDRMPIRTANRILASVRDIDNPRVVCVGATYKPNVKDMRETPALEVFNHVKRGVKDAVLFDPLIPEYACDSVLSVARGADALAILVPHDLVITELQYRKQAILSAMRTPNLLTFAPISF
jgi:UDP-N-acetyl-D-mannosaminuronic acid dehydrogenase